MISETDAAASSEWSTEVYPLGEIVLYQATLTGGAGVTIQPRVGKATSWTDDTQDHIAGQSSAAAYISDATEVPYALATGQTLFGQYVLRDLRRSAASRPRAPPLAAIAP